jgi:hypothetical protein
MAELRQMFGLGLVMPRVETLSGGRVLEYELDFELLGDVDAEKMVVMYPDRDQPAVGDQGKYLRAAIALQRNGYGSIRIPNESPPGISDADYRQLLINNLRAVTEFLITDLKGGANRSLMMMGTGAGASAIAAIAPYLELVDRILLHAPVAAIDVETMGIALSRFKGDLRIIAGEADGGTGTKRVSDLLYRAAQLAKLRERVFVKGADQRFSGEIHDQVFMKAPLWAFGARDLTVPGAKYDVVSGNTSPRAGLH